LSEKGSPLRRFGRRRRGRLRIPSDSVVAGVRLSVERLQLPIVQRKVLNPNDFDSLATVARRLNEFEHLYKQIAEPFGWKFTRDDLNTWLERLAQRQTTQLSLAA
jgi:hypothetical protein